MNNDKRTTRELAIEFWSNLHYEEAQQLRTQYFPGAMLISHADIEHIYLSEHPEQPIKEDEELRMAYQAADMADWENKTGQYSEQSSNRGEGDILEGITGIKWHIDGLTVRDDRNEFVAECMSKNGNIKEDYANARLISKAPELAKENTSLKARIDALLEMEKSDAKFLDLCIKLKARIVLLEDALKLIATTGQPDKDGYISINKATFNLAKEALNQK